MGLDFRLRDFAYPLEIIKLKRKFDGNQWLSPDDLRRYQNSRLSALLSHAYLHVLYYRNFLENLKFVPGQACDAEFLSRLPLLSKEMIREFALQLRADNAARFRPQELSTSGSTGGSLNFLVDKQANILEFVYYWRFWQWHGYRLGDCFAELSAQHFTQNRTNRFYVFQGAIRRVFVNSLLLAYENANSYRDVFRRFKPHFLKGLPSNLYCLALLFKEFPNHGISFRAIFCQGENILAYQRKLIEKVFSCRVFDSYGQMERTVSISQCPEGSYHVHSDYGIAEFLTYAYPVEGGVGADEEVRQIVGTNLHNYAMPLIRYQTQDLVKIKKNPVLCPCQRRFPVVEGILGREVDIVVTPDGRMITALYVALDMTPGLIAGQIIQEDRQSLRVRVCFPDGSIDGRQELLLQNLRGFVGENMRIILEHLPENAFRVSEGRKFKVVQSSIRACEEN